MKGALTLCATKTIKTSIKALKSPLIHLCVAARALTNTLKNKEGTLL